MTRINRHKSKRAASAEHKHRKGLIAILIVAVLAAVPFGLGKYIEFNTPGAFDSGSYVYSAKAVVDGAKIGVDTRPSAQVDV